jgi:hypothetical protein
MQKLNAHPNIPYSAYLGVLGYPGHVAYSAWKLYLEEKLKTVRRSVTVFQYSRAQCRHFADRPFVRLTLMANYSTDLGTDAIRIFGS